jgi:hypothetical protein
LGTKIGVQPTTTSLAILAALATAGWHGTAHGAACKLDRTAHYSASRAENYIHDAEAAWATSVASNDASILRRILSDDFVWVLDDRVLDKATAVREAENGPGDFVSNRLDYAHVRFYGSTAVVQGREHWVRRNPERSGHFIWTDTWVLCGGDWQIVNSQDNSVLDRGK